MCITNMILSFIGWLVALKLLNNFWEGSLSSFIPHSLLKCLTYNLYLKCDPLCTSYHSLKFTKIHTKVLKSNYFVLKLFGWTNQMKLVSLSKMGIRELEKRKQYKWILYIPIALDFKKKKTHQESCYNHTPPNSNILSRTKSIKYIKVSHY